MSQRPTHRLEAWTGIKDCETDHAIAGEFDACAQQSLHAGGTWRAHVTLRVQSRDACTGDAQVTQGAVRAISNHALTIIRCKVHRIQGIGTREKGMFDLTTSRCTQPLFGRIQASVRVWHWEIGHIHITRHGQHHVKAIDLT